MEIDGLPEEELAFQNAIISENSDNSTLLIYPRLKGTIYKTWRANDIIGDWLFELVTLRESSSSLGLDPASLIFERK